MSESLRIPLSVEIRTDKQVVFGLKDGEAALLIARSYGSEQVAVDAIRATPDDLRAIRDCISEFLGET